jgi:hypothetical protein
MVIAIWIVIYLAAAWAGWAIIHVGSRDDNDD